MRPVRVAWRRRWDNTEITCEGRGSLTIADIVSSNDEMDSSFDSIGIDVPELLLVKA